MHKFDNEETKIDHVGVRLFYDSLSDFSNISTPFIIKELSEISTAD